jgi:NAD(P)H-dependent FMN reductase
MIEIIAGTNRPGSQTLRIAQHLAGVYERHGVTARVLDLQALTPECFAPSAFAEKPPAFAPLQARVCAADGLHVVTPEYNGSFPGVLKHFIDLLKFPESFEHKCVAYTGVAAGIWGGFRAVEQLQMVFGYRNAYNFPERVWIPGIHNKWNEEGRDLKDEMLRGLIDTQVSRFAAFVEAHKHEAKKA